MASQTFSIKYRKNTGRVLSASDIKSLYFFGIPIVDPATGKEMSDEDIEFYIDAMTEEVQNFLNLRFSKQIYEEEADYEFDDWIEWGYVPTTFPVVEPVSLQGFLQSTLQIDYPKEWLGAKKSSDKKYYYKKINLVPIFGAANALSNNVIYTGVSPYVGYFGNKHIPNYWTVRYVTGWDTIPKDILNVIGKMTAINIFHQLGDLIVGAGIASKSIGVDGLSQSISTTSSATNAGYEQDIRLFKRP